MPVQDAQNNIRYARCSCAKQQQISNLFDSAAIPRRFQNKTFDNFESERFPTAYKVCRDYVINYKKNIDEGNSLFLVGGVGTGKTHLAYAILQNLVRRGVAGLASTVPELMSDLRPGSESRGGINTLKTIELLVLDDLGSQKISDWVTEQLFIIINARYSNMLPIIVTSNVFPEQLESIPGWKRIVDRLLEMCSFVKMQGESYR